MAETAGKEVNTSPFVGETTTWSHTFAEVGVQLGENSEKGGEISEKEGKISPCRLGGSQESVKVAPKNGSETEHRYASAAGLCLTDPKSGVYTLFPYHLVVSCRAVTAIFPDDF